MSPSRERLPEKTYPQKITCPFCNTHLATRNRERNIVVFTALWGTRSGFMETFSTTMNTEQDAFIVEAQCYRCEQPVAWSSPGFSFRGWMPGEKAMTPEVV